MSLTSARSRSSVEVLAALTVLGVLTAILIRTAWIAGDALVDFRTVTNALDGYGLRWNIAERVQTFTAPLWLFLLIGCTWLAGNVAIVALASNAAFTIGTASLLVLSAGDIGGAAIAVLALSLSRAVVDYSTAGLPDAFGNLLLAAGLVACWSHRRHAGFIAATTGLAVLVRAPIVVMLAPSAIAAVRAGRGGAWSRYLAIAAGPSIAWLGFALFYFGLPLPAPFYAAWFQPHSIAAMAGSGAAYLLESLRNDPITIVLIATALVYTTVDRTTENVAAATGIAAYVVWIIVSGGSTFAGRLLAPAAVAAALMLARSAWLRGKPSIALATAIVLGCVAPHPTFRSDARYGEGVGQVAGGMRDERLATYQATGVLRAQRYEGYPDVASLEYAVEQYLASGAVVTTADIGLLGYAAGPRLTIVDPLGRTDLIAARHAAQGSTDYASVNAVSRDALWSIARLRTVLRLNLSTIGGLRTDRHRVGSQQAKQ